MKAPETQKIVCLLCLRELQCAVLSKENWAHIRWILWEGPKLHMRLTATGDSANKRVSTSFFLFMISICSQQSNYSMKRQRFYCFCILCSKRGDSYEWKTAKLHNWQNMGRQQLEKWRTQKDPTQDILFGYRPSQLTWRTWRDVLAHSFERVISDSEGEALKMENTKTEA